jgi:hypothetical protein
LGLICPSGTALAFFGASGSHEDVKVTTGVGCKRREFTSAHLQEFVLRNAV